MSCSSIEIKEGEVVFMVPSTFQCPYFDMGFAITILDIYGYTLLRTMHTKHIGSGSSVFIISGMISKEDYLIMKLNNHEADIYKIIRKSLYRRPSVNRHVASLPLSDILAWDSDIDEY